MRLVPWRKSDPTWPATGLARQIEGLFDPLWDGAPSSRSVRGIPRTNVAEDDHGFTVTLELPGCDIDDIEVALTGNLLTVQAERLLEQHEQRTYQRLEGRYGTLARRLTLPGEFDPRAVEAVYRDGLLTVRVPKVELGSKAKVRVKGG